MTPKLRQTICHYSSGWSPAEVDITEVDITLVCNEDIRLAAQIVARIRKRGAKKIRICYPEDQHTKVHIFNHILYRRRDIGFHNGHLPT